MASYRVVTEQPGDETMRDWKLWRQWCREQQQKPKPEETDREANT
jgi:hypothetical protein